ncbi:MAG: integrase [Candidatus Bathyarchaeota archaeon]|nr:integrase [Candidatus Bathyarchaeota archaeon]
MIDWSVFRAWIFKKYAKSHAPTIFCYARKYAYMLNGDFKELETFSGSKKNTVLKALIALSKFLGVYEQFKVKLSNYGVKFARNDCFNAFLRIINNNSGEVLEWFNKACQVLKSNEQLFLKFALFSGLRKSEAINSFNLIISLAKENKLENYYNEELSCLEHFRFKQLFLRGKKNTYITFIPRDMVSEIGNSEPITYERIRKRLLKNGLKLRINELRDYFATFMLKHGLIREEVDMLQGRIPQNMFIRSYWSPSFKELRERVFNALEKLEVMV